MSKVLPRYFNSFGKYSLVARAQKIKPNAALFDITDYVKACYLFNSFSELFSARYKAIIKDIIKSSDLVIGRFESFSGLICYKYAKKYHVKFMGEMMSDPWDGLWNHGLLGKIVAPYVFLKTKKAMKNADFGLYVTQSFLQNRYPCPNKTVCASNVFVANFDDNILKKRIDKIHRMTLKEITIMTTAAVYVKYKGQQYVIDAIPHLNKMGINVKYLIVGDGDQTFLRKRAKIRHVESQVFFAGRLSYNEILSCLDQIDIYVQPSLQEGLPRAMIEAMSRGCPCIGTSAGGIPELLLKECLFKKKSVKSFVKVFSSLVNKAKLKEAASFSFSEAKKYDEKILSDRRNDYFSYVKKAVISNNYDNR